MNKATYILFIALFFSSDVSFAQRGSLHKQTSKTQINSVKEESSFIRSIINIFFPKKKTLEESNEPQPIPSFIGKECAASFSPLSNMVSAQPGDFIIFEHKGYYLALRVIDIENSIVVLDEIVSSKISQTTSSAEWLASGAPGHMSKLTMELSLGSGNIKYRNKPDFATSIVANMLEKFLLSEFEPYAIPEYREEIPNKHQLNTTIIIDGKEFPKTSFCAYQSKQSSKDPIIRVFFPSKIQKGLSSSLYYPKCFPYCIEMEESNESIQRIHVYDSGNTSRIPYTE